MLLAASSASLALLDVGAVPAAASPAAAICQLPGVGNVCGAATAPVGAAAGAVTDGVLGAIRTAIINACVWAVVRVVTGLGCDVADHAHERGRDVRTTGTWPPSRLCACCR